LWIIAANDKGEQDGSLYKCRGCLWYHHDYIVNQFGDQDWKRGNRDPYPLLIAFGCILFVCWLVTGIIGLATSGDGYKVV